MPKLKRPIMGRYKLVYPKSKIKYSSVTKRFRLWRKRKLKMMQRSRKINRSR